MNDPAIFRLLIALFVALWWASYVSLGLFGFSLPDDRGGARSALAAGILSAAIALLLTHVLASMLGARF